MKSEPNTTPTYNLKAVIHETGLSPATLRAWERRYGLLKPQRSPGGHRLYSEYDIEILKWLVARQAEGLSISRAVELWRNLAITGEEYLYTSPTLVPTGSAGGAVLEELRNKWIAACLAFDEQTAEQALAQVFAIAAAETVCTEVLQKGLAEIGEGWYTGSVSVQQEHFTSALAMRRLSALFTGAPAPTRAGRILAACPPGEQHDFALLMLAYLLRRRGWEVVYLGANVPLVRLDATIQHVLPRLVISLAQTLHNAASLRDMAEFIHNQNIPLAYGGGIFTKIQALELAIPGHYLGDDLTDAPQWIEHILSQPTQIPQVQAARFEVGELLENFLEKEALIITSVRANMQDGQLEPAHLEVANKQFTGDLVAAMRLGNLNFLDDSVNWLKGLLENNGLSPALAGQYFTAYRSAVQEHLGDLAKPIQEWLVKNEALS